MTKVEKTSYVQQGDKGKDEWQHRHDYAETFFKRAIGELPEMESAKAAANLLADEIHVNDSVLDVGCGAGHYLRSLLERVEVPFIYTGTDATSGFISAAKRAWANNSKASFRVGDILELPFGNQEFDVVMCNNVLLHLPSIVKPIHELIRVARRFVLIRTLIGTKSFRVQEVYSKDTWPFSEVPTADEFDEAGEPVSFGYENIYSRGYFKALVQRASPEAQFEFILDTFFDADAINRSAETEGLASPTRVVDGMQVSAYIITPWHFVLIRLPN